MSRTSDDSPAILTSAEALKALQTAVKGLLFPSESDKPIKAFFSKSGAPSLGNAPYMDALKRLYGIEPAPIDVQVVTLDTLLTPLASEQAWFGSAEKATAQRFRDLEALLNRLKDVKAVRVTQSDAREPVSLYICGYTSEGDLAGIATEVVET